MVSKETWKNIPLYEGHYMASTYGNIKSMGKGNNTNARVSILKQCTYKSGYKYVELCHNGVYKKILVHRLIALTFLKKKKGKKIVNHKNGNKADNRMDNLEWVNASENVKHAYSLGLSQPTRPMTGRLGINNPGSKRVLQFDMNGSIINKYHGTCEASRQTGIRQGNIWSVIVGKRKSAGNFKWAYE